MAHPRNNSHVEESQLFLSPDGEFKFNGDARADISISDEEIRSAFSGRFQDRLTLAELRLIKHLLAGRPLSYREIKGPAYNTRRKQLSVLLHKTGQSRQGEFVQVITALIILGKFRQGLDYGVAKNEDSTISITIDPR